LIKNQTLDPYSNIIRNIHDLKPKRQHDPNDDPHIGTRLLTGTPLRCVPARSGFAPMSSRIAASQAQAGILLEQKYLPLYARSATFRSLRVAEKN